MLLGVEQIRNKISDVMQELVTMDICEEARAVFTEWLENKEEIQK